MIMGRRLLPESVGHQHQTVAQADSFSFPAPATTFVSETANVRGLVQEEQQILDVEAMIPLSPPVRVLPSVPLFTPTSPPPVPLPVPLRHPGITPPVAPLCAPSSPQITHVAQLDERATDSLVAFWPADEVDGVHPLMVPKPAAPRRIEAISEVVGPESTDCQVLSYQALQHQEVEPSQDVQVLHEANAHSCSSHQVVQQRQQSQVVLQQVVPRKIAQHQVETTIVITDDIDPLSEAAHVRGRIGQELEALSNTDALREVLALVQRLQAKLSCVNRAVLARPQTTQATLSFAAPRVSEQPLHGVRERAVPLRETHLKRALSLGSATARQPILVACAEAEARAGQRLAEHSPLQLPAAPRQVLTALIDPPHTPPSVPCSLADVPSPGAQALVPYDLGAPVHPVHQGQRRQRPQRVSFSEDIRAAASPLEAKLMECYELNSNASGGSEGVRKRLREARNLADSPRKQQRVDEALQAFKPNTPGIHRNLLYKFIQDLRAGGA